MLLITVKSDNLLSLLDSNNYCLFVVSCYGHGSDMMYEIRRRKSEPTLLPTHTI